MRSSGVATAVAVYALPPHPPPEVAEAKAHFDAVADRLGIVIGERRDAREALEEAKRADVRAIADAAEQGTTVKNATAKRDKAQALIDDLEVRLKGLDLAVDEAGDELAEIITANREDWLPLLAKAEADAATRFDQAITQAQEALDELRPARGAVAWLNAFDLDRARMGQEAQFAGGRLTVRSRGGVIKGDFDPSELIALAAKVTAPEPPPVIHVPPPPQEVASHG